MMTARFARMTSPAALLTQALTRLHDQSPPQVILSLTPHSGKVIPS
jgi:hypothetical protein